MNLRAFWGRNPFAQHRVPADSSAYAETTSALIPRWSYVPLSEEGGEPLAPCVERGQRVAEGQRLAGAAGCTAPVHSPVPGLVEDFVPCRTPDGQTREAAKIRLGGAFSYHGRPLEKNDWRARSEAELRETLADKGVVNTFAAPAPLAAQAASLRNEPSRILAVRLYDDDPSRCAESFVTRTRFAEIAEGAEILAKAAGAKRIAFLFSEEAGFAPEKNLSAEWHIAARFFPVPARRHPSGGKREIVEAVSAAAGDSPFAALCSSDLFVDGMTLCNAYRAAAFGIPAMEAVVQVSGSALKSGGMFLVRIGTLVRELAAECGGFAKEPAEIAVNGLATDWSVSAPDTPVTKCVKSVRFMRKAELPDR
jgi:electron transport complex protein RnfC